MSQASALSLSMSTSTGHAHRQRLTHYGCAPCPSEGHSEGCDAIKYPRQVRLLCVLGNDGILLQIHLELRLQLGNLLCCLLLDLAHLYSKAGILQCIIMCARPPKWPFLTLLPMKSQEQSIMVQELCN